MLMNFDTELDAPGVNRVVVRREVPTISTVTTTIDPRVVNLLQREDDWDWRGMRDYVYDQIVSIHGNFPKMEPFREKSIFDGFLKRWPTEAFPRVTPPRIARYAFEVEGGWWLGAPVMYTRFCKASDGYFAVPIAEKLTEAARFVTT